MGMLSATRTRRSDPPGPLPGPPTRAHAPRGEWANGATPTPPRRQGCSTVARGDVGTAQGGWGRSAVHRSAPFGWPAPAPRGRGEETRFLIEDCYRSSNGKRKRPVLIVGKSISNDQFSGFCRTPKTEVRSLLQSFCYIFQPGRGGWVRCLWLPRGSGGGAAAAVRRRGVGPAPTPVVAAVCMAGAAPRSGRPSSGETGACRRLHILEGLRVTGRARPCSSVAARTPWSLPLRGVRKAVGGLMWPMGGRHAAETEAVAVAGQEPALRTARRPLLRPQHPNQARRTPAADHPPGRPRRI